MLPKEKPLLAEPNLFALAREVLSSPRLDFLERIPVIGIHVRIMRELIARLLESAAMDFVTKLETRQIFIENVLKRLTHAYRHFDSTAFLLIDINDFKRINDVHGHNVGDAVLQHVARILSTHTRAENHVCRWGGDELCIFIEGSDREAAVNATSNLLRALEANPYYLNAETVAVGVSVGIRVVNPSEFPNNFSALLAEKKNEWLKALVGDADKAMYAAKRNGQNTFSVWESA